MFYTPLCFPFTLRARVAPLISLWAFLVYTRPAALHKTDQHHHGIRHAHMYAAELTDSRGRHCSIPLLLLKASCCTRAAVGGMRAQNDISCHRRLLLLRGTAPKRRWLHCCACATTTPAANASSGALLRHAARTARAILLKNACHFHGIAGAAWRQHLLAWHERQHRRRVQKNRRHYLSFEGVRHGDDDRLLPTWLYTFSRRADLQLRRNSAHGVDPSSIPCA